MKKQYVVSAAIVIFTIAGAVYFAQPATSVVHKKVIEHSHYAKTQAKQTQAETTTQSQINTNTVIIPTEEIMSTDDTAVEEPDNYIPPIGKPTKSASYKGDLNDYDSYQAFGDNQEKKLKQQFIIAAKTKVARLEALLERGKREGISQEELVFAEEKIAGIKAMSEQLQQQFDAQ